MGAGNYQEASKLLLTGLEHIYGSMSTASDTTKMAAKREIFLQPFRVDANCQDPSSSFAPYSWAMLAVNKSAAVEPNGHSVIDQLCAVLLYNSGLCYQARGMVERTEPTSFNIALAVYRHALSLLSSTASPCSVLRLSLLNNCGCILDYFCQFREARDCLRTLHDVMESIYPVSPEAPCREDLLELRLNVTLGLGLGVHAAAA